ncbi:YsnF/AvaK domain-containing protein [Dethiobacter alkaliphilus]|uniref:DUF2382 domain-containing protein n=1 Tax=Dethiobacter alkaliphilus AHT 1 TaxID=555088 RepID=C0GDD2_DETAL|nr:YsnF/AvaK domain-containing protein [Dethiobacter alkaliphilus]EEG78653.1 conserved hypothetical protein [Dethiobacter alkaliphilus AHT 1]
MVQNSLSRTMRIIVGAIVGAFLGFFIGLIGESILPGLGLLFTAIPLSMSITLSAIGLVMGAVIGSNTDARRYNEVEYKVEDDIKIPLREEQLDIETHRVKTSDVDIHKDVITEEKTITVPVSREELVVEKSVGDNEKTETMRIPLSEERIDVNKENVQLNEVSVYKAEFQDTETIDETLKKEKLEIDAESEDKS